MIDSCMCRRLLKINSIYSRFDFGFFQPNLHYSLLVFVGAPVFSSVFLAIDVCTKKLSLSLWIRFTLTLRAKHLGFMQIKLAYEKNKLLIYIPENYMWSYLFRDRFRNGSLRFLIHRTKTGIHFTAVLFLNTGKPVCGVRSFVWLDLHQLLNFQSNILFLVCGFLVCTKRTFLTISDSWPLKKVLIRFKFRWQTRQ